MKILVDISMEDGQIPVKQFRMLAGWMAIHEDELYEAWNLAVRNMPFSKIDPLK